VVNATSIIYGIEVLVKPSGLCTCAVHRPCSLCQYARLEARIFGKINFFHTRINPPNGLGAIPPREAYENPRGYYHMLVYCFVTVLASNFKEEREHVLFQLTENIFNDLKDFLDTFIITDYFM